MEPTLSPFSNQDSLFLPAIFNIEVSPSGTLSTLKMNVKNPFQKDLELIQKAKECTQWYDASKLEDQAESKEAREVLHARTMRLYHAEEWLAGTL